MAEARAAGAKAKDSVKPSELAMITAVATADGE